MNISIFINDRLGVVGDIEGYMARKRIVITTSSDEFFDALEDNTVRVVFLSENVMIIEEDK